MCSYAQSDKSILFIVHTYKAWHSLCTILAVLLFWVACAADLVAINLYEQNKVCLSQFKFLVTSKGLQKWPIPLMAIGLFTRQSCG